MAISYTTRQTRLKVQDLTSSFPSWAHPDVLYSEEDWELLRDTYRGERFVKIKGQEYLKRPSGMDDDEYELYLENATFYPMVSRTVGALVGTVFRRDPATINVPKKLIEKLNNVGKKGESFRTVSRRQARETILMGRYGVLLDRPQGKGDPYFVGYVAEAILDWKTEMINGRDQFTYVVLMEIEETEPTSSTGRRFYPKMRVLKLVETPTGYQYEQHIYKNMTGDGSRPNVRTQGGGSYSDGTGPNSSYPDLGGEPTEKIVPLRRGTPLDYIPFVMFTPDSATVETEQSPMIDIARMNMSHYRSYAHLEQGRFYTGCPIFWVTRQNTGSGGDKDYFLGPSMVWELEPGQKAGLLEFNGNGLKFLESALREKEQHAATLGGRFIGVTTASVSESDNQTAMKDRNEQALLLTTTLAMDEGWTLLLKWWAFWEDAKKPDIDKILVRFNKDFLLKQAAAREFRAIHQMYSDGILPIEVVFEYLQKADVVPDWLEIDEFKRMLEDEKSFPSQPDAAARSEGYPDKKTQLDEEQKEKDREEASKQREQDRKDAKKDQQDNVEVTKLKDTQKGMSKKPTGNEQK